MSVPYMPLYVSDFEADTAHLTIEEDGAFNRLLRLCWRSPGCSVPNDPAWIMRQMRVDQETYDRVVAPIVDEFFRARRGKLYSPRLTREWQKLQATFLNRSSAGKKGGRPRKALKSNAPTESREKAGPKQPEPEPKEDTDVSSRGDARQARAVLSAAVGSELADEFARYRVRKRAPLTPTGAKRLVSVLYQIEAQQGAPPADTLAVVMERGWQSVRPDWIKPQDTRNGKPTREQQAQQRLDADIEWARAEDMASGRR